MSFYLSYELASTICEARSQAQWVHSMVFTAHIDCLRALDCSAAMLNSDAQQQQAGHDMGLHEDSGTEVSSWRGSWREANTYL